MKIILILGFLLLLTSCNVIQKESTKGMYEISSNLSGVEKKIYTGQEKRGNFNPFITGPVEPNINEFLANGPYGGPVLPGEESNPMYGNPYDYWTDEESSIISTKSGAELVFHYKGTDVFIEISGSGNVSLRSLEGRYIYLGKDVKNNTIAVSNKRAYHIVHHEKDEENYIFLTLPIDIRVYSFIVR